MIPHPWADAWLALQGAVALAIGCAWVFAIGYQAGHGNGWRTGFAAMQKIHRDYAEAMSESYDRSIAIFNQYVANVRAIVGSGEKPKKPDLPS